MVENPLSPPDLRHFSKKKVPGSGASSAIQVAVGSKEAIFVDAEKGEDVMQEGNVEGFIWDLYGI